MAADALATIAVAYLAHPERLRTGNDRYAALVILDDDMGHAGLRGMEQAGRRIEVLVKETTMHGFDPRQLAQLRKVHYERRCSKRICWPKQAVNPTSNLPIRGP